MAAAHGSLDAAGMGCKVQRCDGRARSSGMRRQTAGGRQMMAWNEVVRRLGPAASALGPHFPGKCPWPTRSCIDNQPSPTHQTTYHIDMPWRDSHRLLRRVLHHGCYLGHRHMHAHRTLPRHTSRTLFSAPTSSLPAPTMRNKAHVSLSEEAFTWWAHILPE